MNLQSFWASAVGMQRRSMGLVLMVALVWGFAAPAQAQDKLPAESLKWIPADAAVYSSSLRGKEQLQIITQSNAWKRFLEVPAVQMGLGIGNAYLNSNQEQIEFAKSMLELPENQELLKLFGDMFAEEVFFYADAESARAAEITMAILNEVQYAPAKRQLLGDVSYERTELDEAEFEELFGNHDEKTKQALRLQLKISSTEAADEEDEIDNELSDFSEDQLQARTVLEELDYYREELTLPSWVLGFKVQDPQRAETQLKRLEVLAGFAIRQSPELNGRLKREEVAGVSFLTLSLDGSLVPWDEINWEDLELEEGEFDDLRATLQGLTLQIRLGVFNGYLLVSAGPDGEHLARLGQGELLTARKELQPVLAAGDQRFLSVGYVSKELMSALGTKKEDVNQLSDWTEAILPNLGLSEEENQQILADIGRLEEDLKTLVPELGAVAGYSYLTPRGIESFTYNWSENLRFDTTQKLTLLDHLGGTPLLVSVGRGKVSIDAYNKLAKWGEVIWKYAEKHAEDFDSEADVERFQRWSGILKPILQEADFITREKFLPSLQDGQAGFVLDNDWTSRQWHEDQPAWTGGEPLPMLELGVIFGLSDSELFLESLNSYRELANQLLKAIREEGGDTGPVTSIPLPEMSDAANGRLFWYSLPEGLGLDEQVLPNFGVSDSVVALTLSEAHTNRLLESNTPELGGVLSDVSRPLGAAYYFDWAGAIESTKPWVRYIKAQIEKENESDVETLGQVQFVFLNVDAVLEILQVFRNVTVAVYEEDGALVTHSETHLLDLPGFESSIDD